MLQHLHVISCSFAKLRSRCEKVTRSSAQWCYLHAELSGTRLPAPRNYLLHLITDLRPLAAVNPYFPRLNGVNKRHSTRRISLCATKRLVGIVRAYAKRLIVTFRRLHVMPGYSAKMHFHLLTHAISRGGIKVLPSVTYTTIRVYTESNENDINLYIYIYI